MNDDPSGYYARLGVDPAATPEAIAAAFRRRARLLHPDVPVTGDAQAFIRLKEAYDVLSDVLRRAAYDRSAWAAPVAVAPAVPHREPFWSRLADVQTLLWAGLSGAFCIVLALVVLQLDRPPAHVQREAPGTPPPWVSAARASAALPRLKPAGGVATHYVVPATGLAVIWRPDPASGDYRPIGELAAFNPVEVLRLLPDAGLAEIRLAEGGSGLIEASRLAPGDRVAARRAFCAYNAGRTPENGEILDRRGAGGGQVAISNHGMESAVVKMRDDTGRAVVEVFISPGGSTTVANLPDGRYRPEFASGEVWSRACRVFAAGMRAQRFADFAALSELASLVIPPDLAGAAPAVDIPDAVFVKN
jgi:hypothetical protein